MGINFDEITGLISDMKYRQYKIIASHMFRWTNLPPGLESERLEKMLIEHGSVAFFNTQEGFYVLPYSSSGQIDVYGNLLSIAPVTINGTQLHQIDTLPRILWDNAERCTFDGFLRQFAARLAYIQKSIAIVERQARFPSVTKVNETNKESYARFQSKLDEGDPVIFVDDAFDTNAVETFATGFNPSAFEVLWTDYNKVEGEIYNLLGTMFNVEQNKAAGVGTAETIINYAQTFALANSRLIQRQRWCEKLNAEFDLGIDCQRVDDYQDIVAQIMQAAPKGDIAGGTGGEKKEEKEGTESDG